jgi:hypothetical protein
VVDGAKREGRVHIQQISIARHEDVSVAGDGGGNNPSIGGVANDVGRRLIGFRNRWKWREDRIDGIKAIGRNLVLGARHAMKFREDS